MTLAYDLPRIGRYRLYDRAGKKGTLWRCRLCGRSFKVDMLWRHTGYEDLRLESCFNVLRFDDYAELSTPSGNPKAVGQATPRQ